MFFSNYYAVAIAYVLTQKDRFEDSNVFTIVLITMTTILSLHVMNLMISIKLDFFTSSSSSSHLPPVAEPLLTTISVQEDSSKEEEDLSQQQQQEQQEQQQQQQDDGTAQLLELTKPHSNLLYVSCAVLLVRLPLSLSIPHWVAETIGDLSASEYSNANWNILYLFLCGTGDAVLDFWVYYLFGKVQQSIIRDLRLDLFRALLRMEIGFFDKNKTGEITSRLTSDTAEMVLPFSAFDFAFFFFVNFSSQNKSLSIIGKRFDLGISIHTRSIGTNRRNYLLHACEKLETRSSFNCDCTNHSDYKSLLCEILEGKSKMCSSRTRKCKHRHN